MHVELWSRAARLMVAQSGYAALLVSMHGTGLYERYVSEQERAAEPVRGYLAAEHAFQERLRESLGRRSGGRRAQRGAAALLGLAVAVPLHRSGPAVGVHRRPEPTASRPIWTCAGATLRDTRAALRPWPFADPASLEFRVEARLLDGTYADQTSLDAALADAPLEMLTLVLRPGSAGQASPPRP